ncbi:MAG: nucleotidyltransferase domain-containing protein [Patescibacteria group bacterium]
MGFLFSWDQIQRERIPGPEDFDCVRSQVTEALYPHPGVVAASVYGSVVRGDHNWRSDLDLIVICRNAEELCVRGSVVELMSDAFNRRVVIVPHVYTVSEARSGQHPLGPSYRFTLARLANNGVASGRVHQYLVCRDNDIRVEMCKRILSARRCVAIAHAQFWEMVPNGAHDDMERWLAQREVQGGYRFRIFHLYVNIARWLLWWHHCSLINDGKRAVCEAVINNGLFRLVQRDFQILVEADRAYDELLDDALSGAVTRAEYLQKVLELTAMVFTVSIGLLRRASRLITAQSVQSSRLTTSARRAVA